jgi:hypothetical protein
MNVQSKRSDGGDEKRFMILSGTVTFETNSSSAMKMEINKNSIALKFAVGCG